MKGTVVPLVVGALQKRLKTIGAGTKITELQKAVLIHASRIFQKVLEVSGVLLTPYLKNKTYPLVKINVRLIIIIIIIIIVIIIIIIKTTPRGNP